MSSVPPNIPCPPLLSANLINPTDDSDPCASLSLPCVAQGESLPCVAHGESVGGGVPALIKSLQEWVWTGVHAMVDHMSVLKVFNHFMVPTHDLTIYHTQIVEYRFVLRTLLKSQQNSLCVGDEGLKDTHRFHTFHTVFLRYLLGTQTHN